MSQSASVPELVLFIGVPASGKTSFFCDRFQATHVRISLDLLRTRPREQRFLALCLETRMAAVIDNTNPTRDDRAGYIAQGKAAGFRIAGCYFQSRVADCLHRNAQRAGSARIADAGVRACASRLQIPSLDEGFDRLTYVRLDPQGGFLVEEWNHELR